MQIRLRCNRGRCLYRATGPESQLDSQSRQAVQGTTGRVRLRLDRPQRISRMMGLASNRLRAGSQVAPRPGIAPHRRARASRSINAGI